MPDAPILPDLSVIGAGKDALVAVRPSAAPYVERGVWSHLFTCWRAQYGLARQGLAAEVNAARLPLSSGQALTELCQSNFDTARGGAQKAVGELTLTRTVVHVRADSSGIAALPAADISLLDVPDSGLAAFEFAFSAAASAHVLSLYGVSTGTGSHALTDATGTFAITGDPNLLMMSDFVATLNGWVTEWNRHVQNRAIGTGANLAAHTDPDPSGVVSVSPAFASAPGFTFTAQSLASQTSAVLVANALRRAAVTHFGLDAKGGTIRTGTRLSVIPDSAAVPPVAASDHTVSSDLYVPPGVKTVSPRTTATLTGTAGDLPILSSGAAARVVVRDALYDSADSFPFAPASLASAGGTLGQSDPLLRDASSASWRGSWGPNVDALLAGVLTSAGAAHFAELDDPTTGTAYVYAADEAWAQSDAWLALLDSNLRASEWSGVGQKVRFAAVLNTTVRVRMDVFLRDVGFFSATDAISSGIKAALARYFDERPDWYVFRSSAVGNAAAASDRKRILRVGTTIVTDADGVPIPDPSPPTGGSAIHHWRFDDNALDVTFLAPG